MSVKQVTLFETTDGKKFTNEVEANGHEKFLSIGGAIEAYVAAAGLGAAEATRAKKYISGYQAFVETYEGPMELPAPAPAAEAPAAPAANDDQAQAAA